jgi:hypothetical protein
MPRTTSPRSRSTSTPASKIVYEPTEAELEGIERRLQDAIEGRLPTDAEVEATFAKFRRG